MASVLIAHVWKLPALTALNVPAGGVACPSSFKPQQTRVWSSLTAHVCPPPADTCTCGAALRN